VSFALASLPDFRGAIIVDSGVHGGNWSKRGWHVQILLTNDDGIHAPGLAAMERALLKLGDVAVVAPVAEQSGVAHTITYLRPLTGKEVFDGSRRRGWAVDGSPADCVKIGVFEYCPKRPELVISGMNGGLNAGINVLYSGTVAAAIEGAFFGITSIAVSLEFEEQAEFERAADLALRVVRRILTLKGPQPQLYNLNIPTRAIYEPKGVKVVPMGVYRYGEKFEKRIDPRGRTYFWATNEPPPPRGEVETDVTALEQGFITVTPLHFDLTQRGSLNDMKGWDWGSLERD
jgi:5'-nucleotidase